MYLLYGIFPEIFLWDHKEENVHYIRENGACRHLEEAKMLDGVAIEWDIGKATKNAGIILIAVPSPDVEGTITSALPYLRSDQPIVICSKGFGTKQRLLSVAVTEILEKNNLRNPVLYLSGPMIAKEIIKGAPCGAVLAGKGARNLQKLLVSPRFAVKVCDDIKGVALGAALKNAFVMFLGCVYKIYGNNTKNFFINECLEEMKRIGAIFDADPQTFLGLAFLCDMLLPSRNHEFGEGIGDGDRYEDIIARMQHNPEGLAAIKNGCILSKREKLYMPILECVYRIVFQRRNPKREIDKLFLELSN